MTRSRLALTAVVLLALAGCASGNAPPSHLTCVDDALPRPSPATDAAAQVKGRYLDDAVWYIGHAWDFQCSEYPSSTRLKTVRDSANRLTHQLLIRHFFEATGWHYYQTATAVDPDQPLKLSVLDRQVGKCNRISWMGCQHVEEIALDLPEQLLVEAAQNPRLIHIASKEAKERKSFALWLTPEQVREHIEFLKTNVK